MGFWQKARIAVIGAATLGLLVLAGQSTLSLAGGGYIALSDGSLLDWGSFVPAQVSWLIQGHQAPTPCHVTIYDAEDHQTLRVDRCDQMDGG